MSERYKIPFGDAGMRLVSPPPRPEHPLPLTLGREVIGKATVLDIDTDPSGNVWMDVDIEFSEGAPVTMITRGVEAMTVSLSAGIFRADRVTEVAAEPLPQEGA